MPFVKNIQEMPENPAVQIFMTGLLIVQPDEAGQKCEIFVNRRAPDHRLSIEVREKREGLPDSVLMRHLGPLDFLSSPEEEASHGFFITAETPKGLGVYGGQPKPGVDSFNLAIDFNNALFHKGKRVEVDPAAARPSILINDGIFFTAEKTADFLTINLTKDGQKVAELPPFANLIGVNVFLEDKDVLRLRWRQQGLPKVLELRNPPQGSHYEIYVLNDPLFVNPQEGQTHDELTEYYKIISVPDADQLKLDVVIPEPKKGSTKKPCMPIIISQ